MGREGIVLICGFSYIRLLRIANVLSILLCIIHSFPPKHREKWDVLMWQSVRNEKFQVKVLLFFQKFMGGTGWTWNIVHNIYTQGESLFPGYVLPGGFPVVLLLFIYFSWNEMCYLVSSVTSPLAWLITCICGMSGA